MKARAMAALALWVMVAAACRTSRRSAPLMNQAPPGPIEHRALFERHCHPCHPHGSVGLGPSLNDKPLPELAIKTQVREGLGAMPAFPPEKLSDEELEKIVSYVKALRQADN